MYLDDWIAKKRYGDNIDLNSDYIYNDLSKKLPWFLILKILIYIFSIVTVMVCFYKTDIANLTICSISLYIVSQNNEAKQHWLRLMLGGLILTFIIDVVTLIIYFGDMWGYDKEDGGIE